MSYHFGSLLLSSSQIFYDSIYCYASVNIKPVVAGHVLLIIKRNISTISEANHLELNEFMNNAQIIGKMLNEKYNTSSLTYCIQDGKDAGQTIPHIHMHIIPRRPGDFDRNDDIYHHIEEKVDKVRRTELEMKEEADDYRKRMEKYLL